MQTISMGLTRVETLSPRYAGNTRPQSEQPHGLARIYHRSCTHRSIGEDNRMTPQEQQMIDGLIERIRNTQVTDRDPEAAAHLQQGLGGNPDAIYILAQTVLVQQQALLQAQSQLQSGNAELAKLRDAAGHPPQQPSGSWLDRFFGSSSAAPMQGYAGQPQQPSYGAPVYAPQQPYPPQGYPPPQPYPPQA